MAEGRGADRVGRSARGGEDLTAGGLGVDRGVDVLESVAFGDDGGAGADLEGVALDRVPVVVDGVEESVAADLGGAAADVVDVVALESDHVVRAGEVESPVVVVVAGGGPAAAAVDLGVGDGHAVAGPIAENDVLASDQGCLISC